ncbi:MAG: ATP-binding protein, partial [Anaerolineaceae bacterium]|nr:ATP-binding protein [Anaerolineaceae bacterium]
IRASVGQMGDLIEALLNLSRLSRAELRAGPVDLSAMAQSVVDYYRQREPERKVEAVIQPGVIVNGDASLLHVVMDNLIGNAWKFTGKCPLARIEFGQCERADGARACFVRDNGAGFNMAYADKLFGAFQRLHSVSEFPGTGVGLTTVQRIIHRHGGRVWAEGAIGEGATLYFVL